ncbi:MAG: abortive infection family protein [Actinomycetota bacterium]|nr:abortive infection family protein [Actinomycetota bacterium]
MAHLDDDLFGETREMARRITPVTRRDIFDYIRTDGAPWWGRLDEVRFLDRLYDLDELPTTDYRRHQYPNARADIQQHRFNNDDWPDDWVFSDSRFDLASGPDEVLLGFLAQIVHPVVQPDAERAQEIVDELNDMLAPDGWTLKPHTQLSGRPVYAPARTGSSTNPSVAFAHDVATRVDAEYISQQITRMEGAVDNDAELAIGTAKEFVESICKTILDDREVAYRNKDDLPALVKRTTKALRLTADDVADTARAAATIKKMLNNLGTIVQGSAELRNAFGTGHGKSKTQAQYGLQPRHARLAVGAAATLGVFLYETHEARVSRSS